MKCKEEAIKHKGCENLDCRHWINYQDDYNCCLISIDKHGDLTLHECAKRLGCSHVRVKQIQDKAIKKIFKIYGSQNNVSEF
jgi:DNA-directed RNA polymerase specialized sigma subunit